MHLGYEKDYVRVNVARIIPDCSTHFLLLVLRTRTGSEPVFRYDENVPSMSSPQLRGHIAVWDELTTKPDETCETEIRFLALTKY